MDKYIYAIGAIHGILSEDWQKITAYFKSYEEAWEAGERELKKAGLAERFNLAFHKTREKVNPEKLFETYQKLGISVLTLKDENYPKLLKEIFNPPFVIYIKGEIVTKDENSIAIVGARKCTDYGKRATFDVAEGLAKAGITIVSGLALGLDTEAHRAAVKCKGRTLAVLANGLDQIYPTSNTALAREILNNGAIISEQPIGTPALKQNFPARNRIISGLSQGVLITEAGEHSGTLHTANFALEQNRQIYAIPGPIYNPLSIGPNKLLKMGAKAVCDATDILEDFGIESTAKEIRPANADEEQMFEILKNGQKHIDEITKESKKQSAEISQILTMMEIKGKVRHLGGMVYTIRR